MPTDRYEAFYADKIWALLPEIYRAEDSASLTGKGPLRELVERIGREGAILRRSIDRLWEDQAIETCDDWVIPYLADLLAVNLVEGLDSRAQRLDVANTIYYRRRKGTVAILEEIAADVTGWDARVVEFFQRMSRTRHGLDPEIGLPSRAADPLSARKIQEADGLVGRLTGTPKGGFADLRSAHGARLSRTAFDEYSHVADMRIGRGRTGLHNITRLGVFVWRLDSVPIDVSTPVAYEGCPDRYTFDPTGREIQLFAKSSRTYGDAWIPPDEHQVKGPISAYLLRDALSHLYADLDEDGVTVLPRSMAIYEKHGAFLDLVVPLRVSAGGHEDPTVKDYFIDPELGRFFVVGPQPPAGGPLRVGYRYGFSSGIGAGGYDRRVRGQADPGTPTSVVSGGGAALGGALSGTAHVLVQDSLTYTSVVDVTVTKLVIRGENERRPVIRFGPASPSAWTFTGAGSDAVLTLDGLLVSGADIVLAGTFDTVTIVTSTLDPGELSDDVTKFQKAADGQLLIPTRLRVKANIRRLVIDRSIVGPIAVASGSTVETLSITDSIVHAIVPNEAAIDARTGEVRLLRATILGPVLTHRIDVDTSILHDEASAEDAQHGCVRFSAWVTGSALPRKYESVELSPAARLFVSRRFGDGGYAQLSASAGPEISEGAEDGSEMGVFCREKTAIKRRSILVKYQEYMPVGLAPVVIEVT